jgi:hypothetical protein
MVPRETFSRFPAALEHLVDTVPVATRVVAVDAGSPLEVHRRLLSIAQERGVLLLRVDRFLSPNEARVLALGYFSTPYVMFIDNDAFGDEGWLEYLEACAAETGAWAVGPLYGIGHPDQGRVHMAGGRNRLIERNGRVDLQEMHFHSEGELMATRGAVERSPTELIEFHGVLFRTDALDCVPLDIGYLSMFEHNAMCLKILDAGGTIWLEPRSRVTYWPVTELTVDDRAYFEQRWSHHWNRASARHFAAEFGISESDVLNQQQFQFGSNHRVHGSALGRLAALVPPFIRARLANAATVVDRKRPVADREPFGGTDLQVSVVHRPQWADPDESP